MVSRLAADEYANQGALSEGTAALGWALYVLHGMATVLAAVGGALRVDAPAGPAVVVGFLLVLAGAGLYGWGVAAMGSLARMAGTRVDALVTGGPYRLSRHPQNLGWGLVLLGVALAGRSGLALALVAAYAVVLAAWLPVEDRHLRERFGDRFEAWRRRTPAIVGRPRG